MEYFRGDAKKCKNGYTHRKRDNYCVPKAASSIVVDPAPVQKKKTKKKLTLILEDSYDRGTTKKCKNGYKYRKRDNHCVSRKNVTKIPAPAPVPVPSPVPVPKPVPVPSPVPVPKPVPKPAPKPAPVPSPIPAPAPVPKPSRVLREGLQEIIQVEKTGAKCPDTFKYNKSTKMCEKCPDGTRKRGRVCELIPTNDGEDTDPLPIMLPEPDPIKSKQALKGILNSLNEIGKHIGDPTYKAKQRNTIFIYIYLIKKYSVNCFLMNDKYGNYKPIMYKSEPNIVDYPPNLAEQMLDCIKRGSEVIFLPMGFNFKGKMEGHANLLIYRPFKKIIERYEPHGDKTHISADAYNEDLCNAALKTLFEETFRPVLKDFTPKFRAPHEICPVKGFQGIENLLPENAKEEGYCQMWSMFMMETILLNPTLNTEDIIQECLDIGDEDPTYFKELIRGYTEQIAREMQIYLKKYLKYDFRTQNGHLTMEMMYMDQIGILDEVIAETSKHIKPMKEIQKPSPIKTPTKEEEEEIIERVESLSSQPLYYYHHFLEHNKIPSKIIGIDSVSYYRRVVPEIMMAKKISWSKMTDKMYDLYFRSLTILELKQLKYYLVSKEFPKPFIDLKQVSINRAQLLVEVKRTYPDNWYRIYSGFNDSNRKFPVFKAKDKQKVNDDVAKLSATHVSNLLFLSRIKKPPKGGEKTQILDEKFDKEHREELIDILIKNNVHVKDVQFWGGLF